MGQLVVLPCNDSDEIAALRRRELDLDREAAARLGRAAVEVAEEGRYRSARGRLVDIRGSVRAAVAANRSLPPDAALPVPGPRRHAVTRVCVGNETTLGAAFRLSGAGARPLALNFANGVNPGGGFLRGARAQEETLCRSSALHATLEGDPMYESHRRRNDGASSDWAILSPDVPVFRTDDGKALESPWTLSVLTCAAPIADAVGRPRAGEFLRARIHRVLAIAEAFGYTSLVLGAWGCGAFGNDPARTARDFREALQGSFAGAFAEVVFAIADWSPERRVLGPFRDAFAAGG